jgi:N-acetylmuramoyl-L-alanine amidase
MLPLLLALLLAAPTGASLQDEKLADAKARFEQLKSDARRRKYREGWESLLRDLDAAARAAPKGARAAEVALTSARVRVELFAASKSPADARAAFAALRRVDDDHPGPFGLQALHAAVLLSWHTKNPGDRVAAAKRLVERYPNSAEAKAVAARSAELSGVASPRAVADVAADSARAVPEPAKAPAEAVAVAARPVERVVSVVGASSDAQLAPRDVQIAPRPQIVARDDDAAAKPVAPAASIESLIADARAARSVPPAPSAVAAAPVVVAAAARPAPIASKPAPAPAPADDEADEEDESGPPEPEAVEAPPSKTGPIMRAVKDAVASLTASDDEPATAAKARQLRSGALSGGNSISGQLGLKVRRIVIDAGHGGKDTGAIGPHGVREKEMALAIARKVATRLKGFGFNVVMTRSDDTFVALDDRTRIANEARADLFVSIHCNAAKRRKLEGVETWTLNVAADRYAARLAAFENADADRTVSDLRLILADLATKANASDARDLAQSVQSSIVRTLRSRSLPVHDHGTKQALFYVLLGTHMPSILVETGFISNPAEEARLKSARYQDGTADAVARGIKEFVESRRQYASVP